MPIAHDFMEKGRQEGRIEGVQSTLPVIKKGDAENIMRVAEELNIKNISDNQATGLAAVNSVEEKTGITGNVIEEGKVPDVLGMSASDAVFILENAGLRVKIKGVGKVKVQSVEPGLRVVRGAYVYITLG